MRQHKYRAWDKELHMMSLPIEPFVNGQLFFFFPGVGTRVGNHEQLIVEEFTGLQDKNGKEIYEGDKIKIDKYELPEGVGGCVRDEGIVIVEWGITSQGPYDENECAGFWLCLCDVGYGNPPRDTETCCEVIGNVHDAPEAKP